MMGVVSTAETLTNNNREMDNAQLMPIHQSTSNHCHKSRIFLSKIITLMFGAPPDESSVKKDIRTIYKILDLIYTIIKKKIKNEVHLIYTKLKNNPYIITLL